MKTKRFSILTGLIALALTSTTAMAGSSVAAVGARYQTDHSVFTDLPFDDGDISYALAYEYDETDALWQLAVSYCPDVTGSNQVDYVITPQISLILRDGIWRAGTGVLMSYIHDEDIGGDWTDLYWQLLAGIQLPFFGLRIGAEAVYVYESWGDLGDFDSDDLEYNGWLGFEF